MPSKGESGANPFNLLSKGHVQFQWFELADESSEY